MRRFMNAKAVSLAALTFQNVFSVMLMRLAVSETEYIPSIGVLMDEAIKLFVCSGLLFYAYRGEVKASNDLEDQNNAAMREARLHRDWLAFYKEEVFGSISSFLRMGVPAVCFTVQKNLSFYAISQLTPAVLQILFQSKVLTTAFFSHVMLGKEFTKHQKVALVILIGGMSIVELSQNGHSSGASDGNGIFFGSLAAILSCVSSGFAAVYIEYSIKKLGQQEQKSYTIWVRNIQLSIFGIASSILAAFIKDKDVIASKGAFHGFNALVWTMIATGSLGGLLVSLVMKYADNILKTFTTSISIILTVILSTIFLDFEISHLFILGTVVVCLSIYLYSFNRKPENSQSDSLSRIDAINIQSGHHKPVSGAE